MSMALELLLGIPAFWGYIISAIAVIPLVIFVITNISRFQMLSQPLWLTMQIVPCGYVFSHPDSQLDSWLAYTGMNQNGMALTGYCLAARPCRITGRVAQEASKSIFCAFWSKRKLVVSNGG